MRTHSIRSLLAMRLLVVCCAVALAVLSTTRSSASILFSEQFNTDTGNALVTYPAFTLHNGTSASVSSGILNLIDTSGDSYTIDGSAFPSKFLVKADVGGATGLSVGSDSAGLRIGNYAFSFFPGFPNGALQIRLIDGLGAPSSVIRPDQSITFTPAINVLHHMEILVDGINFTIKVTNGQNPLQTGTILFTPTGLDPVYVPGEVGFNNLNGFTGLYDNLIVDDLIQVPEPSTIGLLAFGLVGLAIKSRRRQVA